MFLESAFLPEIQKLRASVKAVEIEITKVKDRMDVLDSQEKFLKSIESSSLEQASLEVALGKPDVLSWENVKVLLSTSSPAVSADPPTLRPWLLALYTPPSERKRTEGVIGGVVGGVLGGTVGEVDAPIQAEMATAVIAESGLHLNFAIKKESQIPSDGSPHKVPIDAQMLKTTYDYFSVPKLKEAAYLRGTFRNVLPYPLLTGNVDLFIQQDFVCSAKLSYVAPEEETEIFFGEDSQVVIKYEQVKKEKSGPGFLGKNKKTRLVYRINVQNFRKNPVEVEIVDQLPVSQDAKIEVKNLNITPAPAKKDEKGILTWSLTLEPQEKRGILIDFTVEYPEDAHIIGI